MYPFFAGLYISHSLTEKQNGSIGVASEPNKGSTFAFYIKARQMSAPTPSLEHSLQSTQELVLRQLESTQALRPVNVTSVTKPPETLPRQKVAPSPKISQKAPPLSDTAYHVLLVEVSSFILISRVSVLTLAGQSHQPNNPQETAYQSWLRRICCQPRSRSAGNLASR